MLRSYIDIKIIVNTKILLFKLETVLVCIVMCMNAYIHCEYDLKRHYMLIYNSIIMVT